MIWPMISLNLLIILLIFMSLPFNHIISSESCLKDSEKCGQKLSEELHQKYGKNQSFKRYLIYDQNFGEGFNLRRDVYIRMALLVHQLGPDWTLVLPKWTHVPHWKQKRQKSVESMTDWKTYFNVKSLQQFIPVIEFNDFINQSISGCNQEFVSIDVLLSLGHFPDSFETNNWSERHELNDCNETKYFKRSDEQIHSLYEINSRLEYKRLICLQIEGFITTLKQIIVDKFSEMKTIFLSNAEIIVNNEFGSQDYWSVRRSMRFSDQLIAIGNQFRKEFLNSNDISDNTVLESDWKSMKRSHGQAFGGQYLSIHLRRNDFAKYRSKDVPNIECAIKQIEFALRHFVKTDNVFIGSDANQKEWSLIERVLNEKSIKLFRFKSNELSDGQLAIVEQWIAIHAMLFIGTYDSTFSFRIQEEREILGFRPNTTFNALCSKCEERLNLCKQESQWKIVY